MKAKELAKLLGSDIFDAEDAAEFLGIDRQSLETACIRHRIRYVQYGSKKFFARGDLKDYARNRGHAHNSNLVDVEPIVVKPGRGAA